MIEVVIFNCVVIYLAYLAYELKSDRWLKLSVGLLFLALAMRYNYGNDYQRYLERFQDVNFYNFEWNVEPGWIFLCILFKRLGFFAMIAFLAAFNCLVYYRFIKNNVPPRVYALSMFIYVFSPGFLLLHASAMRQSVAIALFILSLDYLFKKDALRYFALVGLAALFHTSALILLPVYLLGVYPIKITRLVATVVMLLYIIIIGMADTFLPLLNQFIGQYAEKYAVYEGAVQLGSGIGLLVASIMLLVYTLLQKKQTGMIALLFTILIVGALIQPFQFAIQLVGRMAMYFEPVIMVVMPITYLTIRETTCRQLFLVVNILFILYVFLGFFQSDIFGPHYRDYKTILSAPELY